MRRECDPSSEHRGAIGCTICADRTVSRCNHEAGVLSTGRRSAGRQQPVRLPPDLMGGAVVDPQRSLASARGCRPPRLARRTASGRSFDRGRRRRTGRPGARRRRRPESANSATPISCASSNTQNSNGGHAIFAIWRSRRPNRRGSVRSPCSFRAAATLEKTDQRSSRCRSGRRVLRPSRGMSREFRLRGFGKRVPHELWRPVPDIPELVKLKRLDP